MACDGFAIGRRVGGTLWKAARAAVTRAAVARAEVTRVAVALAVVALAAVTSACQSPASAHCVDGTVCPAGLVCAPLGAGCALLQQIAACDDKAEGVTCFYGGAEGLCESGVCSAAMCGDGYAERGEACDGADLAGKTCIDYGYYDSAGLACTAACTVDESACSSRCGDGLANAQEDCDPPWRGSDTCLSRGYDYGALACRDSCTYDTEPCRRFDWNLQATLDTSAAITGISMGHAGLGFAVTSGGEIFRFDGTSWTLAYQATVALRDVWSDTDGAVFAAGLGGTVVRNEGELWREEVVGPGATINAVWGRNRLDVYVAGDAGLLYRYDGGTWVPVATETSVEVTANFQGVHGTDEILVVVDSTGGIFRGQGASVTPDLSGFNRNLQDVWVEGPSEMYAVGAGGWVLSFDGSTWSEQRTGTSSMLRAVWADGEGAVYVVGALGTALRFDGEAWRVMNAGTFATLRCVGGWGRDWVIAGGEDQVTLHRGERHEVFGGLVDVTLTGVSVSPEGDAIAVGLGGTVLRHDGDAWIQEVVTFPGNSGFAGNLFAVAAAGQVRFAVGGGGVLLRRDQASGAWQSLDSGTSESLRALWVHDDNNVVAVGAKGLAVHVVDGISTVRQTPASKTLNGVWGTAPDDVYAGGVDAALHFDGVEWTEVGEVQGTLNGVIGIEEGAGSAPAVYFVGSSASYRYDAQGWRLIDVGTEAALQALWQGADGLYAVGSSGTVMRLADGRWSPIRSGTLTLLNSVSGGGERLIAVGQEGVAVVYQRSQGW